MSAGPSVTLVEVGLRDGFQAIQPFISTERKIAFLRELYEAGIRRMEVTAFVSESAVPQFSDATEVLAAAHQLPGLRSQVLVPNARQAERAQSAGARHLAFVLSVSKSHNLANVRREPLESVREFARLCSTLSPRTEVRVNLATSFDCPYDGRVDAGAVASLLDALLSIKADVEICLCDTTGRATPDRVAELFVSLASQFSNVPTWSFHAHDTYGVGVANVFAAWKAGVTTIDASFGGLGGCPFAPGATGNVAAEDVVWMFEEMRVRTGVSLQRLVSVAQEAAALPGALPGGRVRNALRRACP